MNEKTLKKKVQVVVTADEHVLLFEFNHTVANNYVGFQNITGEVEGEESFTEAAARELWEEAGVRAEVFPADLEFSFHDRWKRDCLEKVFYASFETKPTITLNEEHLFSKWVPFNEVLVSDYTFPTNYEAFLKVKKILETKK